MPVALAQTVFDAFEAVRRALPRRRPAVPGWVARHDRIFAALSERDLTADDDPLDALALERSLFHRDAPGERFLGYYSHAGAVHAFEAYGFFDALRARGFRPHLSVDLDDPDSHRLRIHDGVDGPVLVDLCLAIRELPLPDGFGRLRVLFVHWLMMQDPHRGFADDTEPLPGQVHPGLGLFPRFAHLLKLIAERLGLDGILNHPSHPHLGLLYAPASRFVDPADEGLLRAMHRDLGELPHATLDAAVARGDVLDADGVPVRWTPAPQLMPVSDAARAWFRRTAWRAEVERHKARRLSLRRS